MENALQHSVAAHLETIQTIDWNQVRTATNSDTDMFPLLFIIEEGMPDHKRQFPPQLRDYYQFREHLYSIDEVIVLRHQSSGLVSQMTFILL